MEATSLWHTGTRAPVDGARIFTGIDVKAVEPFVETSSGTMRAGIVITALNAWHSTFGDLITPVQGQVIATSPLPPVFPCGMGVQLTAHGEYWQQLPDGTILLGGCRALAPAPPDPLAQLPQPAIHEALQRVLPTLFPDLSDVTAQRGWAGAMAFTPDAIPIVDQVAESVWAVGGFSGHGMPFGASIAKLLSAHLINRTPLAELTHLRLDRPSLQSFRRETMLE